MKDLEEVPTNLLWAKIEKNAQLGQTHLDWELYLIRIKTLVQMIENRISRFEKKQKNRPLIQQTATSGDQQTGGESEAITCGLKKFIVEVSGAGIIYLLARDEDDAIAKAKRLPSREMCESMDVFDILEIREIDDHG